MQRRSPRSPWYGPSPLSCLVGQFFMLEVEAVADADVDADTEAAAIFSFGLGMASCKTVVHKKARGEPS